MSNFVLVSGSKHDLDALSYIDGGGEADVFRLGSDLALKVYLEKNQTDERSQKVLALCDKAASFFATNESAEGLTLPISPAFDSKEQLVSGFTMPLVNVADGGTVDKFFFDATTNSFPSVGGQHISESKAIDLCYKLFRVLDRIHQLRLIVGDLNHRNILVSTPDLEPAFIDLDSAAFDDFESTVQTSTYLDPLIARLGTSASGCPLYTAESDNYSLSCLCFLLLIGMHPFHAYAEPPRQPYENARLGHTVIRLYVEPTLGGFDVANAALVEHVRTRFNSLRRAHGERGAKLCEHFIETFALDERGSLTEDEGATLYVKSGLKTIVDDLLEDHSRRLGSPKLVDRRSAPPVNIKARKRNRGVYRVSDPAAFFGFMGTLGLKQTDLVNP